ncbi:diaminopimelate decarboxylase [Pseudomonas frederiksbergensis]|jgi:diaminopimelate decarboxylase|uniref:diaminopimelate decarboxylase n=1 Tax=Pseudomonas TaxID=286 RepID=UPI00110D41E8|nr:MULTISPECIES: diaminopimelate decarboxylase [unclassified Pseudomonas]MBD9616996.1 diaminopimelate decarboxylase [Pseudomonas sp. PDM07]QDV94824.1 diaminopimelate decarboxylase [Pseudomonas sp. ATCC 43928]CAH0164333.1 Diaminopimelate decarboxylase [Pseudomonas sp. Bi130]
MPNHSVFLPLAETARQHGTPLWCYDAQTIRARIDQLQGFDVIRYAQKACSNLHILRLIREQGVRIDAVSLGEIERALLAGYSPAGDPAGIVLTCDLFDEATLRRVVELNIEVNTGSIDMLRQLGQQSAGHRVWLRINPGFGHGHSRKTNTGGENSKHGIWHGQVQEALSVIRQFGLKLVGLHMHIGSGVDYVHLEQVGYAMVSAVKALDHDIEAFSIGGGLSTPYRVGDEPVDIQRYANAWRQAKQDIEAFLAHPVRMEIEPGRFLVAESGYLVTEVRAVKKVGSRNFVLVNAGFNDLMRPALYGAYHHMTLLDSQGVPVSRPEHLCAVGGPLCESGDIFTQDEQGVTPRLLPEAQVGDLLVMHDTGAYGASMSSNYNSRPLLPEVLIEQGQARLIRRPQPLSDLLALELGL